MAIKHKDNLNPTPSRTSQAMEAIGYAVDRHGEVSTRKKIAAWALGAATVAGVGSALWQRIHNDEPVRLFSNPVEVQSEIPVGNRDLPEDPKTTVIEAKQGDTIWTITRRERPNDSDIRPEVDAIVSARDGADLQVGDEIEVPVEDKD